MIVVIEVVSRLIEEAQLFLQTVTSILLAEDPTALLHEALIKFISFLEN